MAKSLCISRIYLTFINHFHLVGVFEVFHKDAVRSFATNLEREKEVVSIFEILDEG